MPTNANSRPTFMVPSTSSENPHKVVVFPECGKVACDQSCVNRCTYSLCSHTLAVAQTTNRLKEFLNWFKKHKRSPNLTSLANINMPQNKGRKAGTRKKKGAANKKPTEGLPVISSRVIQSQAHQVNQLIVQPTESVSDILSPQGQPKLPLTNVAMEHLFTPPTSTFQCSMTPPTSTFQRGMIPPTSTFQCGMTPSTSTFQRGITPLIATSTFQCGMTPTNNTHVQRLPVDPIQQPSPVKQRPDFGSFAFAKLQYLDSRVSRCYGCGALLKPGGVFPLHQAI